MNGRQIFSMCVLTVTLFSLAVAVFRKKLVCMCIRERVKREEGGRERGTVWDWMYLTCANARGLNIGVLLQNSQF